MSFLKIVGIIIHSLPLYGRQTSICQHMKGWQLSMFTSWYEDNYCKTLSMQSHKKPYINRTLNRTNYKHKRTCLKLVSTYIVWISHSATTVAIWNHYSTLLIDNFLCFLLWKNFWYENTITEPDWQNPEFSVLDCDVHLTFSYLTKCVPVIRKRCSWLPLW
jgi:hypothetical protein